MFNGYLCFVVSIFAIGVVTAVIGDVASHFGATLGILDSVTAILFVALGTSIPGNILQPQKPRKVISFVLRNILRGFIAPKILNAANY